MANKTINDLTNRSAGVEDDINFPCQDGVQTWNVTSQQIKAYVTPVSASASVAGLVDTSAQSFAGLKKFEGGLAAIGVDKGTTGSTVTLTNADKRIVRIQPSATLTVTLPTTSIKSQEVWTIFNGSAFDSGYVLNVQSSGGNAVCSIGFGYCMLIALQDTPTTAAHWRVLDLNEYVSSNHAFVYNNGSGGTAPGTLTVNKQRIMYTCTLTMGAINGTCSNADSRINSSTAVVPSRMYPGSTFNVGARGKNSGSNLTTPVCIELSTSGILYVFKDWANANFTANSVSGSEGGVTMSWLQPTIAAT